jgi:ABC-type multidrug transport system permease subunit
MAHHRKRSILLATMVGLGGLAGLLAAYMLLGVVTGVIAMCSWAPRWWVFAYFALAFTLPALAVSLAIRSRRWYLRRREGIGA